MFGINVKRWLIGGVAAGVVMFLIEGAGSRLYSAAMTTAAAEHSLTGVTGPNALVLSAFISLVAGFVLVFFYAAVRPRFGPGLNTAVIVGVASWLGGYFLALLGFYMLGLYPTSMLLEWGALSLVEMILAALVGGWLYQEA